MICYSDSGLPHTHTHAHTLNKSNFDGFCFVLQRKSHLVECATSRVVGADGKIQVMEFQSGLT